MSSSRTAPTSTTASSTSSRSPSEQKRRGALVACGAIAQPCSDVVAQRGGPVDVHPLPPLLHNDPARIADEVERLVDQPEPRYRTVAVGYADCGTYGSLDDLCRRRELRRLGGLHCYDVYAGAERMRAMFEEQPGTYVFTDFLVRSFARTVAAELGLDRHPDLREAYFGNYTRVVWLAQRPDAELVALAESAAARIGLPLETVDTGQAGLEHALEAILVD